MKTCFAPAAGWLVLLCTASLFAEPTMTDDPLTLKVEPETPQVEIWYSQIGFRDTLLFYTWPDQAAVLKLEINNDDKSFATKANVYVFGQDVDAEGIKKWVNNQHSDALFGDAPRPVKTIEIPAGVFQVTSHEFIEKKQARFGVYDSYAVEFEVKEHVDMTKIHLKKFGGKTKVFVKTD